MYCIVMKNAKSAQRTHLIQWAKVRHELSVLPNFYGNQLQMASHLVQVASSKFATA
jgi:hypothetical protein